MGRAQQMGGKMSHFFSTFAFHPLENSESFWGALPVDDWQTAQEAALPAASSARDA